MKYLSLLVIGFGFFAHSYAGTTQSQAIGKNIQEAIDAHKEITNHLVIDVDTYINFMNNKFPDGKKAPELELIALFNVIDKNKNGRLEQTEFVVAHLIFLEFRKYDTDDSWELEQPELMKTMDSDENQQLTFLELYSRMSTGYKLEKEYQKTLGDNYYKTYKTYQDSLKAAGGNGAGGNGDGGK